MLTTMAATRTYGLSTLLAALILTIGCGDDEVTSNPTGPSPPGNEAPVAAVSASPTQVPAGDGNTTVVTIDGSASADADGDPLTFSWTVPNGTFVNSTGPTDATIEVTFPGVIPYPVTLTVADGNGESDTAQVTIGIIGGNPPNPPGYPVVAP